MVAVIALLALASNDASANWRCERYGCGGGARTPVAGHGQDYDGDGIDDLVERGDYGTSFTNPDTDGDGLNDYEEIFELDSDPLVADAAPALLEVSYCLAYSTDADGALVTTSTVFTSDETAPTDCVFEVVLGDVWDGPDSGLVPVYRHTDSAGSHRLSADGVSEADEDVELLFYGEATGSGAGDTISTGLYDGTWVVYAAADAPFVWEVEVDLFETVAP